MRPNVPKLPLLPKHEFLFSTEIPVLIQHINLGNHLGHDSLISLLQEARTRFLASRNLSEDSMILAELQIQYRSEAFYGETLIISLDLISTSAVKIYFLYQIKEKITQRLIAEAWTLMAFYDYRKKKVLKPPAALFTSSVKS